MQISEIHFNPKTIFAFHLRKLKLHLSFYYFWNCTGGIFYNFDQLQLYESQDSHEFLRPLFVLLFVFIFYHEVHPAVNAEFWTRVLSGMEKLILITDFDVEKTFEIWTLLSKVSNILMCAVIVVWEKLLCSAPSKLKEERNPGWLFSAISTCINYLFCLSFFFLCWQHGDPVGRQAASQPGKVIMWAG